MAWNEPGGSNQDPWGGGRNQGPPDLDDLLKKLGGRFGGLLRGKSGGGGSGGGGKRPGMAGIGLLVGVVVIGWLLSGIYIVDEGRRGVELRFGRYVETTMPGPHWHIPYPIEEVEIVNVEERRFIEIGYRSSGAGRAASRSVPREALMLTQDENIVDVRLAVQYQISNPRDYLFNVLEPDLTLKSVVESASRQVIGKARMDYVLTEGRSDIVARVRELSQEVLDRYIMGTQIINVNLQDAQPPEEVQEAFADAIKAREDEQRFKNEAEAYSNEIIPKARGGAARQLEEANAYKARVVAEAEGEAQRFEALLEEYLKAPVVTRKRLYLDAMEGVLANNPKVLLDAPEGNNLLYLPLDQLGASRDVESSGAGAGSSSSASSVGAVGSAATQRLRDLSRERNPNRQRETR